MSSDTWRVPSKPKNCFWVPNEIYRLGLEAGEIAIYGYLLSIEDRKTYQCWPSYRCIGKAVCMSKNTVKKYVASLVEKRLITTEPTKIELRDGRKRNGNLLYTILPIREAVDYFHQRQMAQLEADKERRRAAERLAELGRVAPQEPLYAALADAEGTIPDQGCEGEDRAVLEYFRGTKEKAG